MKAEKAFVSGKIITMNKIQPIAEAVAISGDKILRVGTNDEIAQLVDSKTVVVNLKGKTVIPGFVDAHIHVLDFGKTLQWLELKEVKSIRELQLILKEHVMKLPMGRWIVGRGWNENRFEEKRLPTISDFDLLSPDNPVILYHESSLLCLVNSRALRIAGITKSTVSPKDGMIEKDASGKLTGILQGLATDLAWRKIPDPDENELIEMATQALNKVAEAGITSVHWIVLSQKEISIANKLKTRKKLNVRVFLVIPAGLIGRAAVLKSDDDPMLRLGGGLIVADGYLAAKTAALSEPYADELSNSGRMSCSKRKLASEMSKVLNSGLQLVVQAMGDKAIDVSLTTIEKVSEGSAPVTFPHRLEQPAVMNQAIIGRMRKQNIVASVQPCVIASEFIVWTAEEHLGAQRSRWLYPLKTLSEAGLHVVGGSDCPMEPLNPLLGIQTAVTSDFHPDERISIEEALRMYTINAAFASGEEALKGSIEEGKLADMTVLSDDPFSVDPANLCSIAVEKTLVGGNTVFSRRRGNFYHPLSEMHETQV